MSAVVAPKSNVEAIRLGELWLPPTDRRFCEGISLTPAEYAASADRDALCFGGECGINNSSTVLDIGCGTGRLAIGLLRTRPDLNAYWGVDIRADSILWCGQWITSISPRFRFCNINIHNDRYNTKGVRFVAGLQLPFQDHLFDAVVLYSVFTHMIREDIELYLMEVRRLSARGGKAMFTAYVGEPKIVDPLAGALHVVSYTNECWREMTTSAGLRITRTSACAGREFVGQTAIVVEAAEQ